MDLIIQCHACEFLSNEQLKATINAMIGNMLGNRENLERILEFASSKLDGANACQAEVFVDLKLRQAENAIKYDNFAGAEAYLSEAQGFCAIPPDPEDADACRRAIQILVLRIEFANREHQEDEMLDYGKQALDITSGNVSERQRGILDRVQGMLLFYEGDFFNAALVFWSAITKLAGQEVHVAACVPFWVVCKMVLGERTALFEAREVHPYVANPIIAPVVQLYDAYSRDDVRLYRERVEPVLKVFSRQEYVAPLLDRVRVEVLKHALLDACQGYSTVSTKYLAERLQSTTKEVEDSATELILVGTPRNSEIQRLPGLIDLAAHLVILDRKGASFNYLEGVPELITQVEALANVARNAHKIPQGWRSNV
jgi:hypothetical protein